jgi:hypothetical protein
MGSNATCKHGNVISATEDLETNEEKKHLWKKKSGTNMYLKNKHCEN